LSPNVPEHDSGDPRPARGATLDVMRSRPLVLVVLALGGCLANGSSGSAPTPSGPPPGQWVPPQQQQAYPQTPPAASPQAPPQQAYPQTPPPQQPPAAQPLPWPGGWIPQLPTPISWTPPAGGFPGIPGLPGWPGQAQPAPNAPVQPLPQMGGDLAQRCVDDINRYRATKGLPPLARWVEAEPCATEEAAEDSRTQRAHGSFGRCKESAQNACPNWPGPPERMIDECLKMMWDEGPGDFPAHGHYNNMVDTRSTKVACGTYRMPNGSYWAVQDFR
jgi:hypothetical protein